MNQATVTETDQLVRIELERVIRAPIEDVFDALLEELGPDFETPDGKPLSLRLEPRPGGRWYRDLGDDEGHFWGVVQSIKRPTLLELRGPLFMSVPVCNTVQYRLEQRGDTTVLRLMHLAFGPVTDEMREGMPHGWTHNVDRVAARFGGAR